jgi:hypothetical protein
MNTPKYKVRIGMGIENTYFASERRGYGKNKNLEDCTRLYKMDEIQ